MAVRKGQFSAPAKLTTALTAPSQSLASLDASSWTLGSAANAGILNARPPLLPQLCLGGDQTLHKLWWSGCKCFKSGHGIVGEVSGVEAVIHCGDELKFGVGMEVSKLGGGGYKYRGECTRNPFGISLPLSADLIYIEFA